MTETVARTDPPGEAPPPRRTLPEIRGPVETLVLAWRVLRRMSTALLLLFTVAASSVVATVIPQAPVTPQTVAQWREGTAGPGTATSRVFDALGLFDVFGSVWFMVLVALLFTSLTGCLIPRFRAFGKVARRPPAVGRNLGRLTNSVELTSDLPPAEVLAAARQVLRRRHFRVRDISADGVTQVAAEKGHWREGGSLIFHTAFYVLLTGAIIGKVFGFTGQISVPVGGSFADTRIAYDAAEPGREFGLEDHRGFVVTLDDFEASYFPDDTPSDFVSSVTITDRGEEVVSGAPLRVNHPLRYNGMTLFQQAFGFAPHLIVKVGDRVLVDERVMLDPLEGQNLYAGTLKVKFDDAEQQLALDLTLAPDASLVDGQPQIGSDPEATNPVLITNLYFGALGLERPVPAAEFDRSGGPADGTMLQPGDRKDLAAGNLSVEFADLDYWSGLQVSHAPGRRLLLLGGGLILLGLLPSLYSYRRRVWVDVAADQAGSRVTVAGVALQRKTVFADEFAAITTAVRSAIQPQSRRDT